MLKQEELIKKVRTYNPFLNPEALTKAYIFALKAHKNQKRDSGDPYLIHPVAVADILSDLNALIDPSLLTTFKLNKFTLFSFSSFWDTCELSAIYIFSIIIKFYCRKTQYVVSP